MSLRQSVSLSLYSLATIFVFFVGSVSASNIKFIKSNSAGFSHPHDIVFNSSLNLLYVADMQNDVVKVLNASSLEVVNVIGKGEFRSPHDVALDTKGRLFVADSGNNRIVVFENKSGAMHQVAELSNGLSSPEGVTVDSQGLIYIADTGNDSIVIFKNGKSIARKGRFGRGQDQFIRPHDIEYSSDGKLYISDPGNNRIQIRRPDLTFIKVISGAVKPYNEPKYLSVDANNWLYVADQYNNQLRILDADGLEVESIREADGKKLKRPEGVEVYGDRIWVSDTYNDRILLFQRKK